MHCSAGATFGPAYLFFGCRTRDQDFIYKAELEDFLKAGALTELHVAFSREGTRKDYVQHQLLRQAQTVAYMLKDTEDARGVVYVCGDAKHMAKVTVPEFIVTHSRSCTCIIAPESDQILCNLQLYEWPVISV